MLIVQLLKSTILMSLVQSNQTLAFSEMFKRLMEFWQPVSPELHTTSHEKRTLMTIAQRLNSIGTVPIGSTSVAPTVTSQ